MNVCCIHGVFAGKRRRRDGGFPGSKLILDQLTNGATRKRVGLISQGPVLRQQCKIADTNGSFIGHVTSGGPSPTLGCNIAMAYVPNKFSIIGSEIDVLVRNRTVKAQISKIPFVSCTYHHQK